MGRKMHVPDADVRARIADAYTDGQSIFVISCDYGISERCVRKVLDIEQVEIREAGCANIVDTLSDNEKMYIYELYKNKGIQTCMAITGLSSTTVHAIRKSLGLPLRDKRIYTDKVRDEIAEMWAAGKTPKEIRDKYGITSSTVRKIIIEHGLETNPRWVRNGREWKYPAKRWY